VFDRPTPDADVGCCKTQDIRRFRYVPHGARHNLSNRPSYIELDTHRITGFPVKGWAEQFLQARVAYDDPVVCLEGYRDRRLLNVEEAMRCLLELLYAGKSLQRKTSEKRDRNAEIYRRYLAGEDSMVLRQAYGLSDRRIRTIIEHERKRTEK
jgi:hypothetical protein